VRAPIVLSLFLGLGSVLGAPALVAAAPGRQAATPLPPLDGHQMNLVYKTVRQARLDGMRQNSRFFKTITVARDWSREHVVHHDAAVTAFLDMSDPKHPRYDPENVDEDEHIAKIPEAKRAHILVVPNQPREHIAQSVTGTITLDDINATRSVLESAHKVAKDLGIKNARIYLNTSDRVTVGYLHVHIVGERDGCAYPKLASQ